MSGLEGRVALVTGASRGIGRATAVALGALGARVVVNYAAQKEAAEETLRLVKAAGGEGVIRGFNVGASAEVSEALKWIGSELGRLDVLVNNAGIAIDGLAMRIKDADFARSIEVNLAGTFYACREAC